MAVLENKLDYVDPRIDELTNYIHILLLNMNKILESHITYIVVTRAKLYVHNMSHHDFLTNWY